MFLVTGIINNKECTLEYSNGILTGDTIALEKAKIENTKDHGYIGVIPSVTNKDYLQHECAAAALIIDYVFDKVVNTKNDWYENDTEDTIY